MQPPPDPVVDLEPVAPRAPSTVPTSVTPASPSDTPAVVAMMRRCSRSSLVHRFHGPTDGISFTQDRLRRQRDIVALAWDGPRCVGMSTLAPDSESRFHLGVLVEDDWQRRRIGTRLVAAVTGRAIRQGVRSVHADVMGDSGWVVTMLRRLGRSRVVLDHGSYSLDIDLPV